MGFWIEEAFLVKIRTWRGTHWASQEVSTSRDSNTDDSHLLKVPLGWKKSWDSCPTLLPPHLVLLVGEALVAAVDGGDEQQGAGQGDDGDDQGRAQLILDGHVLHFFRGDVENAELPRRDRSGSCATHHWGTSVGTHSPALACHSSALWGFLQNPRKLRQEKGFSEHEVWRGDRLCHHPLVRGVTQFLEEVCGDEANPCRCFTGRQGATISSGRGTAPEPPGPTIHPQWVIYNQPSEGLYLAPQGFVPRAWVPSLRLDVESGSPTQPCSGDEYEQDGAQPFLRRMSPFPRHTGPKATFGHSQAELGIPTGL